MEIIAEPVWMMGVLNITTKRGLKNCYLELSKVFDLLLLCIEAVFWL